MILFLIKTKLKQKQTENTIIMLRFYEKKLCPKLEPDLLLVAFYVASVHSISC